MRYFDGFVFENVSAVSESMIYVGANKYHPLTNLLRVERPVVLAPGLYLSEELCFQPRMELIYRTAEGGDRYLGHITNLTQKNCLIADLLGTSKFLRLRDRYSRFRGWQTTVSTLAADIPPNTFYVVTANVSNYVVDLYTPGDKHEML